MTLRVEQRIPAFPVARARTSKTNTRQASHMSGQFKAEAGLKLECELEHNSTFEMNPNKIQPRNIFESPGVCSS